MKTLNKLMLIVALIAAICAAARLNYTRLYPLREEMRCIALDLKEAPLRTSLKLASCWFWGR